MRHYRLKVRGTTLQLSAMAFEKHAHEYFACAELYRPTAPPGSPLVYALMCRAIELKLKSLLLQPEGTTQKHVKKYGHDLVRAYEALGDRAPVLDGNERALLASVSKSYSENKAFDYVPVVEYTRGLSYLPDVLALRALTAKVLGREP